MCPRVADITKGQIRAIHVALHRQGIEDEVYRELLRNEYDVDTYKALDRRQAARLLVHLNGKHKPRKRRPIRNPATPVERSDGRVVYLPTPKQFQLIHDLQQEVAWDHADGYARWLKTCLGLDKVVDRDDASKVIQGLKGLKRGGHARRRHG